MVKVGDKVVVVESEYDFINFHPGSVLIVMKIINTISDGLYVVCRDEGGNGCVFGVEGQTTCASIVRPYIETEAEKRGAKFGTMGVVKSTGNRIVFIVERLPRGRWEVLAEGKFQPYICDPSEIRLDHEPEFVAWKDAPEELKYDASRVYYGGEPVKWIAKPEGADKGMDAVFVTVDSFIIAGNEYLTVKL